MFTQGRSPLTGNPLCVSRTDSGLDTATMQAIARQFNLSETTFIGPSDDGGAAFVRIFTPSYEMRSRVTRRSARPTCVARSVSAETR